MTQGHKTWMAAVAFALCANVAVAAQMPDGNASAGGPDASALMAFYGVSLASSPAGVTEDKAVWMAKVQGLIAQAPAWLQQNVLASKTSAEFAANLAILEQMQKGTLESSASAVKSVAASGRLQAKGDANPNLGFNSGADLVYTTLSPCRIMDTRNASGASGVQGPLAGNILYHIPGFVTAGQNWSQYGQLAPLSDCGLNSTAGTNIWAVAIVITILNPNFDAYLGVSDSNVLSTVLSKVALNYTHGQGLSTMYIVPQTVFPNTIYFAMPAGLSANLIFDVVGYFAVNQATPLECNDVRNSVAMTAGAFTSLTTSCGAGFTRTGGGCYIDLQAQFYEMVNANFDGAPDVNFTCAGTSNIANTLHSQVRCCRVPGR